jgi:beta-ureidopropionase / N-carbamoyl-L-amino-acid hydrolase
MPEINSVRLLADLRKLAEFGRYKTGVHRPTYSLQDMAAREWLVEQMTQAGLDASIDGIGNVLARPRTAGPKLLIGSHSESQNHAGWLDGALGVVYGLEIARAFREHPTCGDFPIEVAAWADEEGHFGNFLGSRSFIGDLKEEEIEQARDHTEGVPLPQALEHAGLAGRIRETIAPEDYVGYLEAHIEQGDYLDAAGQRLGVVSGIVGIWQYRIVFAGEQNHAGTTRMAVRKDAGVALVELCHAIAQRFAKIAGPRSVWTTGDIRLHPGQPSIVPGGAEMLFQIRDVEEAQLRRFEAALTQLVEDATRSGPCAVALESLWKVNPVLMSPSFQGELRRAADFRAPGGVMAMPSAAGHDAQILARKIPAAMLFVPSIGGVSHHWTEDTKEDDIVLGCQVLADAALAIFRQRSERA